ncbi:PH domain-containing protein [Brachybacterium sp.]|uniref:PH domain-containing protein n=1 Tax=Brachybacterium sp. TaxID=1891286 RepID=UPI002ED55E7D
MPPHPTSHDPGGTLHLRPHGATALCIVVGLVGLGLTLDAVLRAGWQGVLVLPVLLLLLALVWMVLWAPRVVLHEETVEVRNVLGTHHLPFGAIEEVRLGAMLRFEVATRRGTTSTLTAWNAPALGKDAPWRRQAMMHEQDLRGRRLTAQERLVHDQRRSRSAVVKQRWERWMDRRDALGTPAADGGEAVMTTRANMLQIAVVAVCALLVVARGLF